jgi:hypothetical protein
MAGFNPVAAAGAQGALAQSSLAAIDLGVAIEILQAQLTVGDLLTATILPPQGGADLLSFLGQTVAAQLPPGINPGESLLLQVTGFTSSQIVVRNLGVVDPQNPPPTVDVELPSPAPGTPQQATLTTVLSNQPSPSTPPSAAASSPSAAGPPPAAAPASSTQTPAPAAQSSAAPGAAQVPAAVAPSRAVFVAASVQPAPPSPPGSAPPPQASLGPLTSAIAAEVEAEPEQLGLEARIVATRAAAIDIAELVNTPARPSAGLPQSQSAAAPAPAPGAAPPSPAPPSPSPPSVATTAGAASAASSPATKTPAPAATDRASTASVPERAAGTAPAPVREPLTSEEALLARLRVPVTPVTIAAARLASNAATVLPRALARLDAALANVASQDPRAGSLRALIAFVSRLDAGNVRALPEQLMAFVGNVVDGAEAKLAAIVRQFMESAAEESPAQSASEGALADTVLPDSPPGFAPPQAPVPAELPPAPTAVALPPTPAAPSPAPAATATPALSPEVAAHVAERMTALQYDLKATIVALSESLPRGAPAELAPALNDALTAITAMQLNVLGAQNADPSAITIPLPMFFHENGRPVQLRISKDAPRGGKLDADNFHIAFVLDTQSLGTVAVDLQTVGRAVSVNVKTEGAPAASRFRETLDDLRGRLEELHYRVFSIAAGVAPHRFGAAPEPVAEPAAAEPRSILGLDMQA